MLPFPSLILDTCVDLRQIDTQWIGSLTTCSGGMPQ